MRRSVGIATLALALLACTRAAHPVRIVVVDTEGSPIANARLSVEKFGWIPTRQTRVALVTTDKNGEATFSFVHRVDYAIYSEGRKCEFVGGNEVIDEKDIEAGTIVLKYLKQKCSSSGEIIN